MTPPLRRSHRIIWLVLAVALPAGFGAAIRMNKEPLTLEPVGPAIPAALPVVVQSVRTPGLIATLRRADQTPDFQLDIIINTALEIPSAVVRVRQPTGWRAVGLLDAPGLYRFPLPAVAAHPTVEVFDDVHQRTIHTFQF